MGSCCLGGVRGNDDRGSGGVLRSGVARDENRSGAGVARIILHNRVLMFACSLARRTFYLFVLEPAKAVARPREMRMPPET